MSEVVRFILFGAAFVPVYIDGRLDGRYGVHNRSFWASIGLWGLGGFIMSIVDVL